MLYEFQNSMSSEHIKLEDGYDFSFPLHMHGNFELFTVTEGEMTVTVDKKVYTLKKDDALLIFPNQAHEISTVKHSCHFLCIFSPMLVQAYSKIFSSKLPTDNKFRLDGFYVKQLQKMRDTEMSIMQIKGLLYTICGEFDAGADYTLRENEVEQLTSQIFRYVEDNYSKNCSLAALSSEVSYNYVYLSKYFKKHTGIAFTDYVNRYRINEACYILQNTDQTILKIAYDCGFDSLRSFNRNFKSVMGMTPSEYRAKF